jgi:hypothetical protein
MPTSSKWSISLRFPHQNYVCISPAPFVLRNWYKFINQYSNSNSWYMVVKLGLWSTPQWTIQINSCSVNTNSIFLPVQPTDCIANLCIPFTYCPRSVLYLVSYWTNNIISRSLQGTPVAKLRKADLFQYFPTVRAPKYNRYFPSSVIWTFLQFIGEKTYWVTKCVYIELHSETAAR